MSGTSGNAPARLVRWLLGGAIATGLALAANVASPTAAAADHIRPALPGTGLVYVGGRREYYRHRPYRAYRHYRPYRVYRPYGYYRPYRPYYGNGIYFSYGGYGGNGAAAVFGLAAGAILGQALAAPRYIDPPVRRVYRGRHAPWTPAWYSYCAGKYRSFNPGTGYYLAYSGRYRFCR